MVYLHVSDLHLGLIDPIKPGGWNAPTPPYSQYLPLFKGQWGHHFLALQRLQEFYDKLVIAEKSAANVRLVMSGDATAFGKPTEFHVANRFLAGQLNGWGLRIKAWRDLAIPGNHDHWPGSGRILGRPKGLRAYFPEDRFPCWTWAEPLAGAYTLRFISINTDADVRPYSRSRLRARGAFHNQIDALDKGLPNRAAGEVRVLLLHHPALFDRPAYQKDLSIVPRSAGALDQCLVNHGISVLMCGHTHAAACVKPFVATAPNGQTQEVVECCCGTTTQRERIPSTFRTPAGEFPNWKLDPNTLLVHRFEVNAAAGRVELVSQGHVLTSTEFAPYGSPTRYQVG
jgi:hypothetical protein